MAIKKVTYKEPASYFTPSMRKVAEEWEKEQAKKKAEADKVQDHDEEEHTQN